MKKNIFIFVIGYFIQMILSWQRDDFNSIINAAVDAAGYQCAILFLILLSLPFLFAIRDIFKQTNSRLLKHIAIVQIVLVLALNVLLELLHIG